MIQLYTCSGNCIGHACSRGMNHVLWMFTNIGAEFGRHAGVVSGLLGLFSYDYVPTHAQILKLNN